MRFWIGYEKEGELKGIKTLFVGSRTIKEDRIEKIMSEDCEIEQIYFGAGCCTKISMDILKNVYEKYHMSNYITAEIDIKKLENYDIEFLKKIRLILTIENKNFSHLKELESGDVHIKVQSIYDRPRVLGVCNYDKFEKTNLDNLRGKCYDDDVVLE